jgi:predicted TIM-barrel fold metal-dependent hydrolase
VVIVDAHIHLGYWPRWNLRFALSDLYKVMTKWGYYGAIVMPALVDGPEETNENLLTSIERAGPIGRLYFFAWFDSRLRVEWLREKYSSHGIHGLKFHASISQQSIEDHRIEPYLDFANRHRLPLLYHCGRTPISWPGAIKRIAPSYPDIKFILAHLGGTALDRILETKMLFKGGLPENIYVGTSTARHPRLLARLFHEYGPDRMLFGTDLPFTSQRMNFDCLRYAGLDRHEGVMGGNILKVLGERR